MRPRFLFLTFLSCLPLFFGPGSAPLPAGAAPADAIPDDAPIKVTADTLVYDTPKNAAIFQGDVEAQRADFFLWSSTLTLYLRPTEGNSPVSGGRNGYPALTPGDLDRIVAEKNVRFRYRAQSGSAGKATYTVRSGLLVLEGNPVLREGDNSITGNTIRYYLNENRSEIEGGPGGRVEAIFTSGGPGNP